ncbi:MAG TPA: hypothetical protein VGX91_09580 [Candidatus Cybelea sp.]|nr:hypothetical protein [Candidatus Cybelea sp.]
MTAQRIVTIAAVAAVAGAVVAAFLMIGSPQRVRTEAIDERRLRGLGDIASDLYNAHRHTSAPLPAKIDRTETDPITGDPYEYRRLGPLAYELCADFALPTPASRADRDVTAFWHHTAGHYCYRFDVRNDVPSTL